MYGQQQQQQVQDQSTAAALLLLQQHLHNIFHQLDWEDALIVQYQQYQQALQNQRITKHNPAPKSKENI